MCEEVKNISRTDANIKNKDGYYAVLFQRYFCLDVVNLFYIKRLKINNGEISDFLYHGIRFKAKEVSCKNIAIIILTYLFCHTVDLCPTGFFIRIPCI